MSQAPTTTTTTTSVPSSVPSSGYELPSVPDLSFLALVAGAILVFLFIAWVRSVLVAANHRRELSNWTNREWAERQWEMLRTLYKGVSGSPSYRMTSDRLISQLRWNREVYGAVRDQLRTAGLIDAEDEDTPVGKVVNWFSPDFWARKREVVRILAKGASVVRDDKDSPSAPAAFIHAVVRHGDFVYGDKTGRDKIVVPGDNNLFQIDSPGASQTFQTGVWVEAASSAVTKFNRALTEHPELIDDEDERLEARMLVRLANEHFGMERVDARRVRSLLESMYDLSAGVAGNAIWEAAKLAIRTVLEK